MRRPTLLSGTGRAELMPFDVAPNAIVECAGLRRWRNTGHFMGMPALEGRRWTATDVRVLTDEARAWPRFELLDGELLVTPAPDWRHQLIVGAMHVVLATYCRAQGIGVAVMSPADIELHPESIMQPDNFVIPEELIPSDPPAGWEWVRWLLLAVEVLSPSTQRQDRVRKREFYLDHGVREYWIVDGDARVVERWTATGSRPEICRDALSWHPVGAREPLRLDVQEFFVRDCRLPRRL